MTATLTAIRDVLSAELRTRCIDLGEHLAMSLAEAVERRLAAHFAIVEAAKAWRASPDTWDGTLLGNDGLRKALDALAKLEADAAGGKPTQEVTR